MRYALTVGSGRFLKQSVAQIKSLRRFATASPADIIATCPPSEWQEIPCKWRDWLDEHTTVRRREFSVSGYPQSANLSAFIEAFEFADSGEWVVLLDTDCLVLSPLIEPTETTATVRAKPLDKSLPRSSVSRDQLETAFEIADVPFPGNHHQSTVDGMPMPPSWNAGVVFARDEEFALNWVELTRKLQSEFPGEFFLDQLALAPLGFDRGVDDLGEQFNFPVPWRFWVPHGTSVLHYHQLPDLFMIANPIIQWKLHQAGVWGAVEVPPPSDFLHLLHRRTRNAYDRLRWRIYR